MAEIDGSIDESIVIVAKYLCTCTTSQGCQAVRREYGEAVAGGPQKLLVLVVARTYILEK